MFFKSDKGKEIRKQIALSRSEVEDLDEEEEEVPTTVFSKAKPAVRRGQLLAENAREVNEKIKEAIRNAKSLEEIERLNQMLRAGQIPSSGESFVD